MQPRPIPLAFRPSEPTGATGIVEAGITNRADPSTTPGSSLPAMKMFACDVMTLTELLHCSVFGASVSRESLTRGPLLSNCRLCSSFSCLQLTISYGNCLESDGTRVPSKIAAAMGTYGPLQAIKSPLRPGSCQVPVAKHVRGTPYDHRHTLLVIMEQAVNLR